MNTTNKSLTPKELIVIAEQKNQDSSIVLSKKLKPLSKKERLKYLEDLIMLFRVNDEQDEMIKAMTPVPLTDYIIMLREFEEKHNRKPNQREKNQMYYDELKDKKLHSDEYYRLRTKAEKWLSDLQDDFITKEIKSDVAKKNKPKEKRGNPNFIKEDMPEGFYNEADRLKRKHPKESNSWYNMKLREKFFNSSKSKKSTIDRRLKEYWGE